MKNPFVVRPLNDKQYPWGVYDLREVDVYDGFVGRFISQAMAEAVANTLNRGAGND